MNMGGDHMFIFPYPEGKVGGAGEFNPSKDGVRVYSDAYPYPNLEVYLDLIESVSGKVLKPKIVITKEIGHLTDFMDAEVRAVSLHSYA